MKCESFIKITLICLIVLTNAVYLSAQYQGAPVKKDRLIKALRSKQLQTRDIVSVIRTNGVDFALTPGTRQLLVAAGARPEVIKAVADNPRLPSNPDGILAKNRKSSPREKSPPANYEDMLDQAMFSYKDRNNPQAAVRILEAAVKLNPKSATAYQMLGFVNLYGLKNLREGEKLMRRSVENGGSAVFRVYHDDSGGFSGRCAGSLYISPESIRFESDDNRHTFETSVFSVDKFTLDTESNREWKKHSVFKILLKIGREKAGFRFAPVTGNREESKMAERLVLVSKTTANFPVAESSYR